MTLFYQGLKQIERFLTSVAGAIDPIDHHQQQQQHHHHLNRNHTEFPTNADSSVGTDGNHSRHPLCFISSAQTGPSILGPAECSNIPVTPIAVGNDDEPTSSSLQEEIIQSTQPFPPLVQLPIHTQSLSTEDDFRNYYNTLLENWRTTILESINRLLSTTLGDARKEEFMECIRQQRNAEMMVQEAKSVLDGPGTDESGSSMSHFKDMEFLLEQCEDAALDVASRLLHLVQEHLDGWNMSSRQSDAHQHRYHRDATTKNCQDWEIMLLQCTTLQRANPMHFAAYAVQGIEKTSRVHNLLRNPWLLKHILMNGGPRGDQFTSMLDIYHGIMMTSHRVRDGMACNDIFHRLALAVALEHAVPIKVFDTSEVIDPIARYQHYENAHVGGELDSSFSSLTVWELRMVVNNDASDDEIHWCRDMLRNYRPDHITERVGTKWHYCMIVKTDVRYKRPEWAPNTPRTYQQMLSGGGMCGPRAWFGRYVCKSFGVPTWGVRQPGHAAMSRRMSSGMWDICLGGPNWKKSYWNGRNGVDFELECRARLCGGVDEYQMAMVLDCLAELYREQKMGSQHRNYTNRDLNRRFWTELCDCKKKLLAKCAKPRNHVETESNAKPLYARGSYVQGYCLNVGDNQLIIPAAACHEPTSSNQGAILMSSLEKDKQTYIHLRENGHACYRLTAENARSYLLHLNLVTLHSNPKPIRLQIVREQNSETNLDIQIPYTRGQFGVTESSQVHLGEGLNELRISRCGGLGVTIKEFVLTPC